MAEPRSRLQKIWDAAIVSAVGTVIAALVLGFCAVVWRAAMDMSEMRADMRASRQVFTEQLAQIRVSLDQQTKKDERIDQLEAQLQELVAAIRAADDDRPLELEEFLRRHEKPRAGAPNAPSPQAYEDMRRKIREDIHQQQQSLK